MSEDATRQSAPTTNAAMPKQAAPTYDHLAFPDAESRELREDDPTAMKDPSTQNTGFAKTLTIFDMVVYGLIFMVPIAPFSIYGNVFQTSNGMPALAYLIGMVAMLFTALSFGVMVRLYPSSGSIFTYASKGIGRGIGFVTGWLMLLQYLICPNLMYILAGIALQEYFPEIPVWVWCLIFMAFVTLVTLRGVETTIIIDRFALVAELIVLFLFMGFGLAYVVGHPATSHFSATAIVNPPKFSFNAMMGAVALSALSYVGFGSVATLTEEAKDGPRGVSKAIILIVLILGCLFFLMCYIATCVDPTGQLMAKDWDNGFYVLASLVGGDWFGVVCVVAIALAQGVFTGMAGQTSVARILYIMGKSGALPRFLGKMNAKTKTPTQATLFVSAFSLATLFILIPLGMDTVAEFQNFGALSTYCLLNIVVIWHCWIKEDERHQPFRLLICPAIGAIVVGYIFCSLSLVPIIVGICWTIAGIIYYVVQTRVRHVAIDLGDME